MQEDFSKVSSESFASFHAAGTSTFTRAPTPSSTALLFIATTSAPFLPYVFSMESFKYSTALSIGMIVSSVNLKNAACVTMLIRPPKPISAAIFAALMM